MFRSRTRKIFRDLWSRKARTILASLSIFIGVLGVVILVSMGDLLIRQLREDLKEDELAMQQVSVTVPRETAVDNARYIETLEAVPGVMRVEGRAVYPLFWKRPGDEKFEEGFIRAAWEPFGSTQIEPARLTAGGRLPVAGSKEIAIEKRMADQHHLTVGDQLVLRVLSGGSIREETWTIVGVLFQPYTYFGENGFLPNESSVFATYADAQEIVGFTGLSRFYVRYSDFATAEDQADDFEAALAENTPYIATFSFVDDPANNIFLEITQQISGILIALAAVAMVVSGFLVVNIINAIVVEQKRQIGVMKSLGATRWDNVVMYAGAALGYGVIGVIPGVLLGIPLGFNMAAGIAPQANSLIEGFRLSTAGLIVGVVMGLLVPLVAALIPVFLGTRVTILEAMTDLGIASDYGRGLFARVIAALPVPITIRQALSNVNRKKGRLLLTGITLTLAVASFMAVFGIFFSLNEIISSIFETTNYEISVSPSEGQDFEQISSAIRDRIDGVKEVYPGTQLTADIEGYAGGQFGGSSVFISGIDPESDTLKWELEAGTAWQGNPEREGIVLTSSLAGQIDKQLGDRVVMAVAGQKVELEVIGLVSFPFDQAFMEWQQLSRLAGLTLGAPTPNSLLIQMDNVEPTGDQVDAVIDQISELLVAQGVTANFTNQVTAAEESAQQILSIGTIFTVTALVMAAVGAIGLLATLSMAVFERQKEIGVMRSIGAGSLTVAAQFLVEGVLVGVIAWIVGAPLSYVLSQVLAAALPFGITDIKYPPVSLLIGLVGMITVATVSSLWPSISAARKTVSEIIRYQ
jgi:putative ABC transport system permease protein